MSNFLKRTLSGIIFVALIIGSIYFNPYFFAFLFLVVCSLSVLEFHTMTNQQEDVNVSPYVSSLGAILIFSSSFVYASGLEVPWVIYFIYPIYLQLAFISQLYRKKKNPIHNLAYLVFGQIYVVLPFALLNFILFAVPGYDYYPFILLALFLCIWGNDTGAYLVGISFGKHRLFERISPKKSWEGFFGGALVALLLGYVFSLVFPVLSLLQWMIFVEIVVIFGTFGDLTESLIKRTLNVKDSSNLLPGHGGLLDRFDSMLLAAPAVFIYLKLIL